MKLTVQRCRSCPADIVWAVTTRGRPMPVDAEPHPDGNIRLIPRMGLTTPRAEVVTEPRPGEQLRHSHFTTCPDAGQHRRPRGKGSSRGEEAGAGADPSSAAPAQPTTQDADEEPGL
jgi:hypothetical protein